MTRAASWIVAFFAGLRSRRNTFWPRDAFRRALRQSDLRRPLFAAIIVLVAALNPGCTCGNGIAKQLPFSGHIGDTMVNCVCNIDICHLDDNGHHDYDINANKTFKLCLPPELNTHTADSSQLTSLENLSEDDFKVKVNDYCAKQAESILFHIASGIYSATYGFCAEQQCAIDENDTPPRIPVQCFAQAIDKKPGDPATAFEPTCQSPCGDVECDFSSTGNCSLAQVEVNHDIHPENCQCNKISTGACGQSGGTDVFCGPMPAMSDPASVFSSPVTDLMIEPIEIEIDPTTSYLTMQISPGAEHDQHTVPVYGTVAFYGKPCPSGDCDLLMGMSLYPADFDGPNHFHYTVAPDEYITNMSIFGGTLTRKAHFHANGTGTVTMGDLQLFAHANQREDGALSHKMSGYEVTDTNPKDVNFTLPLVHNGTFSLGPASISGGDDLVGANGTLVLSGHIKNLPPIARAGTYPPVECTSPQGAQVTLDANGSSDPDGDPLSWQWFVGGPFDAKIDTRGSHATTTAPIGTTQYSVTAADTGLLLSYDRTSVTVVDTAAPTIVGTIDPDCLWPPNHSMILFQLGDGLDLQAKDACDDTATLKIVNVSSNQPPLADGSGNTIPDVAFGSGALCVRAERDGTVNDDRQYTVTVESTDHAGNTTRKDFVIRVPHDQGGGRCSLPDANRVVADGDPRCTTNAPVHAAVTNQVLSPALADATPPHVSSGACEIGGHSTGHGYAAFVIVALIALMRRRSTMLLVLIVGAMTMSACSQSSSMPDCLKGWWRDGASDACLCPTQPECSAGDCVAASFIGFDGTSYHEGTYTWSASAHTMSSEGTVSSGTYSLNGNQMVLTRSSGETTTFTASCSGQQMSLNGAIKVKASSAFASTLAAAASAMTSWSAMPVSSSP